MHYREGTVGTEILAAVGKKTTGKCDPQQRRQQSEPNREMTRGRRSHRREREALTTKVNRVTARPRPVQLRLAHLMPPPKAGHSLRADVTRPLSTHGLLF